MATFIPAETNQPMQSSLRPANGQHFSLEELYCYTNGGPIEVLSLSDGRFLVCNEEAKWSEPIRKNVRASEFVVFPSAGEIRAMLAEYAAQGVTTLFVGELPDDDDAPADFIAGDVLICEAWELE